jgi:hypothetical protein
MQARLFAAGMALLVGCATPTAINDLHQAAAERTQQEADMRSIDQLTLAHELPGTPPDVAATFVELLAEGGPDAADEGCLLFSEQAASQLAAANHAPNCPVAMRLLQEQVTDSATYANDVTVPATAWSEAGTIATVNGCEVTWSGLFADPPVVAPGPLPGRMTVAQLDGYGWQVVGYQPC